MPKNKIDDAMEHLAVYYDKKKQKHVKRMKITDPRLIKFAEEIRSTNKTQRDARLHDLYHYASDNAENLSAYYLMQVASILLQADSQMNLYAGTLLRKADSPTKLRATIEEKIKEIL